MILILRGFLSLSLPNVDFHSVLRYCQVTREGPREHVSGFEEKLGVIEESELQKSTDMVNKIERGGVL